MHINQFNVPGSGTLHRVRTRRGEEFGLLIDPVGTRTLFLDDSAPEGDADRPARGIQLDADEADQIAQLLLDKPITDRVAELERRLAELDGHALGARRRRGAEPAVTSAGRAAGR